MANRTSFLVCLSFVCINWLMIASANAQNAPGEDPVRIDNKVIIQGLPNGPPQRSGNIGRPAEIPPWQKAKMARYEAKAFSGNRGDVLTERDVINTANSDGFKTTCTQSIGSVSTPAGITTGGGFKPTQQIVVLRGDLINICN